MSEKLIKMSSTFFYIGYAPIMPGSFASLAGLALGIILSGQTFLYLFITCLVTGLGFYSSGRMARFVKEKDPSCVVIDEVAGMLIAFFGLPVTPQVIWPAFFLFRAFDMFKIYPANVFEEKPGSVGIMLDDIMAGIYANLVMQIALFLVGR